MEIRDYTLLFAKRKERAAFKRETEISKQLEELDYKICNSDNLLNIDDILRVIVREHRAVPKDWGQPISFIFSAFKSHCLRKPGKI